VLRILPAIEGFSIRMRELRLVTEENKTLKK
jgi:hypothetical protein